MATTAYLTSPEQVREALASTGYLCDEGLATIAYLAVSMNRPLLLEGEPGTGKTSLAEALAEALGHPLIRLQCYEGIDATQALYDWDFTKQILHLRALEAAAVTNGARQNSPGTHPSAQHPTGTSPADVDLSAQHQPGQLGPHQSKQPDQNHPDQPGEPGPLQPGPNPPHPDQPNHAGAAQIERSLFDERFLLDRPLLKALRGGPSVLLIDEIDRADDEFEAFLLEILSAGQVTIPELGTIRAEYPPIVVLTSNRTRELHDALKRRCLYHWIDHPSLEREVSIVRTRLPGIPARLADQLVTAVQQLRTDELLIKPPGVAESLDWARALVQLGTADLDLAAAAATVGAICKHREDLDRVRASLDRLLAA